MKSKMSLLNIGAVLALLIATSVSSAWAQQVRIEARKNKVINGVEAELRGDYREKAGSSRLNAELENINVPVGTKVAFCMLQSGAKTLIGVGHAAIVGGCGRPDAFQRAPQLQGQLCRIGLPKVDCNLGERQGLAERVGCAPDDDRVAEIRAVLNPV